MCHNSRALPCLVALAPANPPPSQDHLTSLRVASSKLQAVVTQCEVAEDARAELAGEHRALEESRLRAVAGTAAVAAADSLWQVRPPPPTHTHTHTHNPWGPSAVLSSSPGQS